MTLQVGIINKDAIILASDTCMTEFNVMYDHTDVRKIVNIESQRIAYAISGDEGTRIIGKEFAKRISDGTFDFSNIENSLIKITYDTCMAEATRLHNFQHGVNRKLLIAFYGREELQLWQTSIKDEIARAERITGIAVAGDTGNEARAFARFYPRTRPVSLESSKFVAAHIILSGHSFNSLLVDGLELALIRKDSFQYCAPEELQNLAAKSSELYSYIEKTLIGS